MTADRWREIERLFDEVVVCPAPEREALLDRLCQGDEALKREVQSLLACDNPEERLVEIPDVPGSNASESEDADMAGRRIGPYHLVRLIGHGGMGAVYLGVRDDQFQKQVAIKLLKRGMDTDFMLSRFRQERQILANLEHPFIARLMDGGATEDGLPYFVMEYVDGVPITTYCAEKNLSVPERLRLFRLVCEAVQYAHQNLVVHRDIKPSNILTTKEGIPKLLDFGIAKVLDPRGEINTALTRELRMLTPEYASPEQIKGLPISTGTDTYSLGAVLYELLARVRPHRFASSSLAETERTICETEPERLSSAAAQNEDLPPGVRKQLRRELSGDLDNIVLTAMRKEPQRRYASAAEFSEDLRRHMEGLPIRAHEDRWTYRARKFVVRNRMAAGAALLVAASLIGGIVTTTFQARRAERRFQIVRRLANSMLFELHDQMERLPGSTELRAATIRTVVKYLDDLARDGSHDPGLDLEIAAAYERAGNLEGHPFESNLGRSTAALSNYRKALAIYERLEKEPGFREPAVTGLIDTNLRAGQLASQLGDPAAAEAHSRRAAEIANQAFADTAIEIPRGTQVHVYFRIAEAEYNRGEGARELAEYLKALALCHRWVSEDPSPGPLGSLRDAYRNVGSAQGRSGDLYGALESYRKGQKIGEQLLLRTDVRVNQHYNTINVYTAIGDVMAAPDDPNLGDWTGALNYYQKALELAERIAANDANNMNARRNIAICHQRLGMIWLSADPAKALTYYRKSLTIAEELSAGDPANAEYRYHASRAHIGIGEALHNLRRHSEAIAYLRRSIEFQEVIAPERIWNRRVLSRTYVLMGRALLAAGDISGGFASLQQGFTDADRMVKRAPSSLFHQLDRAEANEALGDYYLALSRKPDTPVAEKARLRAEALSNYQASLVVWQSWIKRKLAAPYAGRRERLAAAAVASASSHR
jgi:serine/threonine protein kinase